MSIRQRMIITAASTVGIVGGLVGWYVAEAPEASVGQLDVVDTAGILDAGQLDSVLTQVRFHEPTDVAIYTVDGGTEALTNDLALNDAVREYAETERSDWLSPDRQYFADDLFIFAVDPTGRLVGTYFGENRTVGQGAQNAIQDAAKDDFREDRWTDGTIDGVEVAADRINAPFIRNTGGAVVSGTAGLAALAGLGIYTGVGVSRARRTRTEREVGDRAMDSVLRDDSRTRYEAKRIPADSRYGDLMLQRFRDYTDGFTRLTDLRDRAHAIPDSRYDRGDSLGVLTDYREQAEKLDHLDDVIADAAALLNRDQGWQTAWQRQVDPILEDLAAARKVLTDSLPESLRDNDDARAVGQFVPQATERIERLRGDLEAGTTSPDDALDQLRATRDEVSRYLEALGGSVVDSYAEGGERDAMREALDSRRRSAADEPSIISTAYPTWMWLSFLSFHSGVDQGRSDIQALHTSSSSGGAATGYSGGGFSGSGSSSRF